MISKSGYTCQDTSLICHEDCNLASSHLFSSSHACYSSMHYSALARKIIALKNLGPSQRSGPSQLATAHLYITRDTIYIHSNHKHFDTLQLNVGKYCPIGNETFICRTFFFLTNASLITGIWSVSYRHRQTPSSSTKCRKKFVQLQMKNFICHISLTNARLISNPLGFK